ncbi:MAG: TIGR03984 family CRISPR-associated protein [Caldilineaceae bacterium]|nr:TIGR03984 family CRISPR-associated protein [Caldilineaceae bacterium]
MASDKLRKIEEGKVIITPIPPSEIGADPVGWLQQQAVLGMLLLAHADDVVIWGRATSDGNGKIHIKLSSSTQTPLRNQTLIMARLFDAEQEWFLWQVAEGEWRARRIHDSEGEACSYFDESQILWGDKVEMRTDGFVHLVEGAEGMRHTPPEELLVNDLHDHKAKLTVRHYLQEDDGWLRVAFSRLVKPEEEVST